MRQANKGRKKVVFQPGDWDVDSRTNPFQERGYDEDMTKQLVVVKPTQDPLHILVGPITRSRAIKMQRALSSVIEELEVKEAMHEVEYALEGSKKIINKIEAQVQV
ncbi:hypothetical protein Patl1_32880 [Pistacia atlantica]|uniref:Uncharacterized protein n=1 Tax=Pistacia atlantica TaxID=434234 RepID=A0ACC1AQR1_9ROSI|nr:hypothetical protein Patl1_32880 [Pistacia atlantica]